MSYSFAMQLVDIFRAEKPVIGMLHVPALPGSPRNSLSLREIQDWVLTDAGVLAGGGLNGFILENFGDVPFYPGRVPPHTVAFMTHLGMEVRRRFDLPLGINILRNDAQSALAVANAVGAEFIRVNIHTGARLTDQGVIQGEAHEVMRYRRTLAASVRIFADADVKHSAPLAPRKLEDEVEEILHRGGADAVIVTGAATGRQTSIEDLRAAKSAAGASPVIAGSGVDLENIAPILGIADAVIVGSALKRDNIITNPVDGSRVRAMAQAARQK